MKSLINTVISSLKTRYGERVTDGPGEALPLNQPELQGVFTSVRDVTLKQPMQASGLTTLDPLYQNKTDLKAGTCTVFGCYAEPVDFKYCAEHATTQKQEEKIPDAGNVGQELRKFKCKGCQLDWEIHKDFESFCCYCGEMVSFKGGRMKGVKHDEEKARYAMLSPAGLEAEAKAMTYGAKKYGDYNWRKGIHITRYVSAALRHIFAVVRGEQIDPESGVHHFGLARANLGMALQTLEDHPELNDMYKKDSE